MPPPDLRLYAPPPALGTADDDLADLVDSIPGFAGLVYEGGKLTVLASRPSDLGSAGERVRGFLGRRAGDRQEVRTAIDAAVSGLGSRLVRYDFRQLLAWYRAVVIPELATHPGVTMTDVDELENRIVVGVRDRALVSLLQERAVSLPIPNDALVVAYRPDPPAQGPRVLNQNETGEECDPTIALEECPGGGNTGGAGHLQGRPRPVPGGLQLAYFTQGQVLACTLGYNVVKLDNGGTVQPERYLVTAAHCTDDQLQNMGAVVGTVMHQPEGLSTDALAVEVIDPPFTITNATHPDCPQGRFCRFTDAALFQYSTASEANHGRLAFPGVGQLTYETTVPVTSYQYPIVGMSVSKVGSTTGHTTGTVTFSCTGAPFETSQGVMTNLWFLCQGRANYGSGNGDSGAPVVQFLGSPAVAWAVGIHRASAPYFGDANAAMNEFTQTLQGVGQFTLIAVP